MRIFLVGYMGAGKSAIGVRLARMLNLQFFDLDSEVESRYKMSIPSIFDKYDEACFRKLESTVLRTFSANDNFVLSCGGGTPCFNDNMDFMNSLGTTVYIKLPAKGLAVRIKNSVKKRPLADGKSEDDLAQYVEAMLKHRDQFYSMAKLTVEAAGVDKDHLVEMIVKALSEQV